MTRLIYITLTMLYFGLPVAGTAQVDDKYQVKPPIMVGDSLYCWDVADVVRMGNAYKDLASMEKQRDNLYLLYQFGVIDKQTFERQSEFLNGEITDLQKELKRSKIKSWVTGFFSGIGASVAAALVLIIAM